MIFTGYVPASHLSFNGEKVPKATDYLNNNKSLKVLKMIKFYTYASYPKKSKKKNTTSTLKGK